MEHRLRLLAAAEQRAELLGGRGHHTGPDQLLGEISVGGVGLGLGWHVTSTNIMG